MLSSNIGLRFLSFSLAMGVRWILETVIVITITATTGRSILNLNLDSKIFSGARRVETYVPGPRRM